MPRFRLVGNVVLSYLTKIASGYWGSMDSQNGYAAISLYALETADIDGMYEYYGYCNDLLVRLNAAGVRIADVPRSAEYAYTEGWKSHIEYTEYIPRVSAMLVRSFAWRLRRTYIVTNYNPVAPLYVIGAAVTGLGSLGFLHAVASRDDSGSWLLSTVIGVLTLLYATLADRAANEELEAHLDPAAGTDAGDTESPSTDAQVDVASVSATRLSASADERHKKEGRKTTGDRPPTETPVER